MRVSNVENVPADGTPVQQTLTFNAVARSEQYPEDGSDENNTYARWTPTASVSMCVTNPALFGKFEVGQEYYVDFTKAD